MNFKTSMETAMEKVMKLPTRNERIFNYIKEHPNCTSTKIASALNISKNNASSCCSLMVKRQMLDEKRMLVKLPNRSGRLTEYYVYHYSCIIPEFEVLPIKKNAIPAKKRSSNPTIDPILVPILTSKPVEPAHYSVNSMEELLDKISVKDAHFLFKALSEMFK